MSSIMALRTNCGTANIKLYGVQHISWRSKYTMIIQVDRIHKSNFTAPTRTQFHILMHSSKLHFPAASLSFTFGSIFITLSNDASLFPINPFNEFAHIALIFGTEAWMASITGKVSRRGAEQAFKFMRAQLKNPAGIPSLCI
jgi:hypothetical protein